ncbi:MAG: response regulator [Magnetococcales bacterium]|nr:response regulator [Magnetococcales bacterium]
MKVLIVDDSEESIMVFSSFIKPFLNCDVAKDGKEAVDKFKSALINGVPYALVLLDIVMPLMDGQEALKRMRQIEKKHKAKHTIIIMTTAVDAQSEIEKALKNGKCTDYLNKPITRGKLLVKLHEHKLIPDGWWKSSVNPI